MKLALPTVPRTRNRTLWWVLGGFLLFLFLISLGIGGYFLYKRSSKSGDGSGCDIDTDCRSGLFCGRGVCQSLKTQGEPCTRVEECQPGQGLICNSLTKSCQQKSDIDGPCGSVEDCLPNLVCSQKKCMVPKTAGERCENDQDCVVGLGCQYSCTGSKTCKPKEHQEGESCNSDRDCSRIDNLICKDQKCAKPVIYATRPESCPEGTTRIGTFYCNWDPIQKRGTTQPGYMCR